MTDEDLKSDIHEIKTDLKSVLRQLPNDESIQTESNCEQHRSSIEGLVDKVIKVGATVALAILGWLFYLSRHIK